MAKIIVKAPFYKPGHKTEKGQSRGGYAQYIGTREGVEILRSGMAGYIGERHGSHGLFSDEGVDVSLSKISEEIDNHPGNVWGFIVSLKREDAERVGYNSAEQWVNLLRSRRNIIAKEMGIAPSNLRWVAAYHNKETNPHVHMMVWSSRPQEPYLSREGIHNIKKTLASDIFRQEHLQIYKKQTEARDDIKASCRNRIEALVAEIRSGKHAFSLEILAKMELLSEKLQRHKGKKVYGYLDKNTKALVKDIVKMLGADEQISAIRTILLPPDMIEILAELKKHTHGEWMFPSPVKEGEPRNPSSVYHRFQLILERSHCKKIRFHDLRHTFATMALENGMDIKTLSAMIGHISSETTLNIYSHITDTMQQQAAVRIDREIGGTNAEMPEPPPPKASAEPTPENATETVFEPYKPKIRKSGTGCVTMINDHLYEGRFTPRVNGKRISKNVYAKTREECEEKLAELIKTMKAEIAEMKKVANA